MANMKKFEIDEVNCHDSFVTVTIRGDMIGTVANCLRTCGERRNQWLATQTLGDQLRRAGDMIYEKMPVDLGIAYAVVKHDGKVYEKGVAA